MDDDELEPADLETAEDEPEELIEADTRGDPQELREEIQHYYLSTQLVDAIMAMGGIPSSSKVMVVGVGFLDIADYSYLSQFLSPQENQVVLNGLYTAFAGVLKRHGGYLNKIEGDSMMFHYGGSIDRRVKGMSDEQAERYIARELFFTCVEMQRVCSLFNQANERFLLEGASDDAQNAMRSAFDIISMLRNSFARKSINALFQIRIRLGANIGEVTIGNFGPPGAKQWDVVGNAVIDAKRMESTAPIGGLRISEALYEKLVETRIADEYFNRFKREAMVLGSYYRDITAEELFKYSEVLLKDKRGAKFRTYSVQVTPNLPESIAQQVTDLLSMGPNGAGRVLDMLKYYRGNPYVINAIEDAFRKSGIVLRKHYMLEAMYPRQLEAISKQFAGDSRKVAEHVDANFALFDILDRLGRFQDLVKQGGGSGDGSDEFSSYGQYMREQELLIRSAYDESRARMVKRAYFFNVVFPLVFESVRSSILEYQLRSESEDAEDAEELEALALDAE